MPRKPRQPKKLKKDNKDRKEKQKPRKKRDLSRGMQKGVIDLDRLFREQRADPNPARRFLSYNGMAERFGGSKNVYVRLVEILQDDFNAPLEFIHERGGWGYTKDIASLPNIFVDAGDLSVLCASWGSLERRRNGAFGDRVRPVMEKLMEAMGHDLSFDFATVAERIVFRSSGYHDDVDIEIFETVLNAVLHQRELRFVYQKPMENGVLPPIEHRHVQPRCLIGMDNAFYIAANDPQREGKTRRFALFRMQSAEDTGIHFTPSGPFDVEEFLRDSMGIHGGGKKAAVELWFERSVAGLVQEHFWHDTEEFSTAPDGRLRLTMEVAINPELEVRIQRWGSKVEVIAPQSLRDTFARYAREDAAQYGV